MDNLYKSEVLIYTEDLPQNINASILQYMSKEEKDFINALITKCNLHPKQVKTINDLDIDISYLKHQCPQDAISYIRTTLDYDKYILDYCMNRKIKTNG